jgi:D-serine deaminase-like pyridoxal phosphate-dependent protein
MDLGAVAALGDELLDWRYKGVPLDRPPVRLGDVGAAGWDALDDLAMPVMLLSQTRLAANVEAMASFCRDQGALLAPHGKTSMAPQLFARQLAAGCWALTAATPAHLRVYRRFGVQRILYANQLVDPGGLRWLAAELRRDPTFELVCLADSVDGVSALADGLAGAPVEVLVEVGHADGRTGCRTPAEAVAVARAVAAAPGLTLAGIEAFEGTIRADTVADTLAAVDAFMAHCEQALRALVATGLLDPAGRPPIVSAGGSAWFDRVLAAFGGRDDVVCVLRSGCYLTHDGGFYEERSPLAGRATGPRLLHDALEVWGRVLSRPQPDQAIVSFGKRDVPFDIGLPVPSAVRGADGVVRPRPGTAEVTALSDQHAHLRLDPAAHADLAVGDLVAASVSHPCGVFERWRLLFVVDDDRRVVDGVLTFL